MEAVRNILLGASALGLAACMGEMEASSCGCGSPPLLDFEFAYDNLGNPGFAPKPPSWNGDTLTVWDLWAVRDQPEFRAAASLGRDTVHVEYLAGSAASLDWSPPVETRLRFLAPKGSAQVNLHFLPAPNARAARHESELAAGVQDASRDRYLAIPRP